VQVLRLIACDHSGTGVARQLAISAKTVQHHVGDVYEKLGMHSRAAGALFATEHGLLSP